MTGPVLCVGDLMVDVVVRGALPAPGGDAPVRIDLRGGGSAANTACWLSRAGVPAAWAGRVGDDALGGAALDLLREAGVEVRVELDRERPTGVCVVLIGRDGERTMLSDRGANAAPAPAAAFDRAAWVHVSGYADAREAVGRARAAGIPASVDPGPQGHRVRGADVLLPSLAEARALTGEDDPADAARALGGEVVVTLGADGAMWTDGRRLLRTAAVPVAEVVDTAGAGDAFAAGFLAARLRREPPEAQLAAGATLAAECVATPGARPLVTG